MTGASWGSALGLAYAQAHPERVTALALFAVTNTSTAEVEWITESMARIFPSEWERFAAAVDRAPGERIIEACARALRDGDASTRTVAAAAWGEWENTHVSLTPGWQPDQRWQEPATRDVLATLVTHYWSHSAFGGDHILGRMDRLKGIPGVLIHGRQDISSPLVTAYRLHRAWPGSRLAVVDEGHGGPASVSALCDAITDLATAPPRST